MAGGLIQNIYILEWRKDIDKTSYPAREKLIPIEDSKSIRIKAIETENFGWVFEAFGTQQALNAVSPKTLRALLSRSYVIAHAPRVLVKRRLGSAGLGGEADCVDCAD